MTEEGRMKIAKNEDGRWGRSKAIRRVHSDKTSDGRNWQYFFKCCVSRQYSNQAKEQIDDSWPNGMTKGL
jgi:hypothetical protein